MYPKRFIPARDEIDDFDEDWSLDPPAHSHRVFDDEERDLAAPGRPHDPLAPLRPTHERVHGQRTRRH